MLAQKPFEWGMNHVNWSFLEAGHGKGAADGIGGVLKRTADRIVAQGADLPNAEAVFECLSRNINMEGQRRNDGDESETSESFGVPDCSLRSGDLDNEKTREKEDRRFRVVVLEKSTESIVDGEKDKHMDNREHQTGMDTGVKGAKGCIKLLWARGESRRDGR